MFAYIPFGSSKSALPGELENNLAYSSNLDGAWRLSNKYMYMYARSIEKGRDDKVDGERRIKRKVSVEANSLREKVIWFGRRTWPVRFCIVWQVLNLFCASVLEFCSTEVELIVLIELSRSVDFRFAVAECGRELSSILS